MQIELLAPAGNMEAFYGCMCAGADAIYLAGNRFGARAYANNFSEEELLYCIKTAHIYGKKIYLTVNTLIKTTEFDGLYDFLKPLYEAGLDAVIVQDPGVILFIHTFFPDMEIHASTQMTITGADGALFLKDYGVTRIVPARELSFSEIEEIKEKSGLEIECFVHGALCYCYSGQCLFSSVLGGRSGNRGRCAQPCRLPYSYNDKTCFEKVNRSVRGSQKQNKKITDNTTTHKNNNTNKNNTNKNPIHHLSGNKNRNNPSNPSNPINPSNYKHQNTSHLEHKQKVTLKSASGGEVYPLSLKDLCTIDFIPELIAAGIDSFKIEGRMKKPEYACGVTGIYRKVIDSYLQTGSATLSDKDRTILNTLYLRSQKCDGYYQKRNSRDMITMDSPAYNGCDNTVLEYIRSQYLLPESREKSDYFAPLPLDITISLSAGNEVVCTGIYYNPFGEPISVSINGPVPEAALSNPITEADVKKQLSRLGGTNFSIKDEDIHIYLEDGLFYSLKSLNNLRRDLIHNMENSIIESYGLPVSRTSSFNFAKEGFSGISNNSLVQIDSDSNVRRLCVSVKSEMQLHAVTAFVQYLDTIYIEEECLYEIMKKDHAFPTFSSKTNIYLALCQIRRKAEYPIRDNLIHYISTSKCKINGLLIRNLEDLSWLIFKKAQNSLCDLEIRTDYNMYIWNPTAYAFFKPFINRFAMPLELSKKEQYDLLRGIKRDESSQSMDLPEKKIYGRIPLMITANCVQKTCKSCLHSGDIHFISIKDRTNRLLPIEIDCIHCMNTIYNSIPLSLHQDLEKLVKNFYGRIDFTTEDPAETQLILRFFIDLENHCADIAKIPYNEYTSAYEKNGVE